MRNISASGSFQALDKELISMNILYLSIDIVIVVQKETSHA